VRVFSVDREKKLWFSGIDWDINKKVSWGLLHPENPTEVPS